MLLSFLRAFSDLFRRQTLIFILAIPLLSGIVWLALASAAVASWGPGLTDWLTRLQWFATVESWLSGIGISMGPLVLFLVVLVLIFPLVYWTALIVMAFFALPWIMSLLKTRYPTAFVNRAGTSLISTWKFSAKIFLKATPAYGVLLALSWIPGVFVIGNFVLGAIVNAYFISIEILGEILPEGEMRTFLEEHRGRLLLMGAGLMLLLAIPFLQLITPVFAGLWFSHYILAEVDRRKRVQD